MNKRENTVDDIVFEKLANSRDDAKSAVDIANELDMPSRKIYAIIRDLRRRGVPIVSDKNGKGYWIAKEPHDIRMWARQSQAAAFDMLSTASKLLNVADSMEDDQISLI